METSWIDEKFVRLLAPRLEGFKVKQTNPLVANCRCPFCGDSKKSRSKARGFFFRYKGGFRFKCHNCGKSSSIKSVLYELDQSLWREYKLELMKENGTGRLHVAHRGSDPADEAPQKPAGDPPGPVVRGTQTLLELGPDHPAVKYVALRGIPPRRAKDILYVDRFFAWVNGIIPGKFSDRSLERDHGRIVFMFKDRTGKIYGFTGRSVNNEEPRYVAIKVADHPKAFGMESVDWTRPVYIVEGPIDSLFLENAVAMGGSDADMSMFDPSKDVVVFDNEPRNEQIVKKMASLIEKGWRVVIWPDGLNQKDINDMYLAGLDPGRIISENTFQGPRARVRLHAWKKTA